MPSTVQRKFPFEPIRALLLAALLASVSACELMQRPAHAETEVLPRVVVCGIDRSRSYPVELGLRYCAERLRQEQGPGWGVARFIAEDSYSPREHLLRIPLLAPGEAANNPFDVRSRSTHRRTLARRDQVLRRMAELKPPLAGRTDVPGFLASAADVFAQEGRAERWLYISSDLASNAPYAAAPDLSGVRVRVYFLPPSDPAAARRRRTEWTRYFEAHGAEDVEFVNAEISPWNLEEDG